MNNQDTFNIICTFITPKQLSNFCFLSKIHNKWVNLYLIKNFKKINIEEYTCPKCANWLDNKEDISNYNEFNDYYLTDDIKESRFSSIEEWVDSKYGGKIMEKTERSKILCDDCEYNEDYSDNIFENFKYKGSREYTIIYFYNIYSWVALCLISRTDDSYNYLNSYNKYDEEYNEEYNEEYDEEYDEDMI